jgi:hypothetical protein
MALGLTTISAMATQAQEKVEVHDDDDVYFNKLQTKVVKKSILYMYNVDQPIRHK